MMAEEWATLSTTVQYGRRRPGRPLDHHLLHRPDDDGEMCAFVSNHDALAPVHVLTSLDRSTHCADRLRCALQLIYYGYLCPDKPWSAAGDGVARHDAMVCFVSVRVAFKAACIHDRR